MAGILGDLGVNIPVPQLDVTGFFSNTWLYVFIIGVIGFIVIVIVALLLFYRTYNRKVTIFENISGQGYHPTLTTRARIVSLGISGEEVLKTLAGGRYLTAYGRKMSKNSYWFAKGQDGYLYNFILGDLDTKMAMLDIEPIDRDVRMFHVALDRLSSQTYGKPSFLEKYGNVMFLFLFLCLIVGAMWIIIGRIGEATDALVQTAETNKEVVKALPNLLQGISNIKSGIVEGASGIVPAVWLKC